MIRFILIPLSVMLSCGSTKNNQSTKTDSVNVQPPVGISKEEANGPNPFPTCIKNKIDSFKLKEAHEKPQRVLEYMYKGKKVYYVVMPCCDFFNEVYDAKCNFLGSPDGGFTGKGDGKIPDFFTEAKSEKLVWGTPK